MNKKAFMALAACAVLSVAALIVLWPFAPQPVANAEAPAAGREAMAVQLLRQKLAAGVSEIVLPGGEYVLHAPLVIQRDVSITTTDGAAAEFTVSGPFRHVVVEGENAASFENISFDGVNQGGGGLEAKLGGLMLVSCTVKNCEAAQGGGLRAAAATLTGCEISENLADTGGGIYADYLEMTNCAVIHNTALEGDGGGMYVVGAAKAENSTVYGNAAGGLGGGGSFLSDLSLTHCSFSANRAENGGGVALTERGKLDAVATLIAGNVQTDNREVICLAENLAEKYSIVSAGYAADKIFLLDSNGVPILAPVAHTFVVEIVKGGVADDKVPEILIPRDQAGFERPLGAYADIGAVEANIARQ